jgi:iron complex transport system permease protein
MMILFLLLLALSASVLVSLFSGGSDMKIGEVLKSLVTPFGAGSSVTIVWKIRIPRIILAFVVGYGLASTGAGFQGILRNSLADPYTLGISGGASFGATLGIIMKVPFYLLPLFAFGGSLIPVAIALAVSEKKRFTSSSLILTGVILSFLFSSIVMLLFSFSSSSDLHQAIFFLMGDLTATMGYELAITTVIVALMSVLMVVFGRDLDALSLGEEKAHYLGIDVKNSQKTVFIISSLIVAACVSVSGIIGFVGLMAPHFIRRLGVVRHRILIPLSGIAGAVLLVISDAVARTVAKPVELPVGVITGIFGAIFFIIFYFRGSEWKMF